MRKDSHSKETKDKILALWNSNMSAQRIADRFAITRNTVIGMIKTMRKQGFDVRTEPRFRNPYKKRRAKTKKLGNPRVVIKYDIPKKHKIPSQVMLSKERWVPLLHLGNGTCRYTKDGNLFCNEICDNNNSYCNEHIKKMYSSTYTPRVHFRFSAR